MTLKEYLDATADFPEPILRSAMTAALAIEPARTPDECRRFYARVVSELRRGVEQTPAAEHEDDHEQVLSATLG